MGAIFLRCHNDTFYQDVAWLVAFYMQIIQTFKSEHLETNTKSQYSIKSIPKVFLIFLCKEQYNIFFPTIDVVELHEHSIQMGCSGFHCTFIMHLASSSIGFISSENSLFVKFFFF